MNRSRYYAVYHGFKPVYGWMLQRKGPMWSSITLVLDDSSLLYILEVVYVHSKYM